MLGASHRFDAWKAALPWVLPLAATVLLAAIDSADTLSPALRSLVDHRASNIGDPWPTVTAARVMSERGAGHLYESFSPAGSSFIYPPIAALLMTPFAKMTYEEAHVALSVVSRVLYVACVAITVAIAWRGGRARALACGATLGLLFFPLLRAVELNQATLAVGALLGAAIFSAMHGKDFLAGALIGVAAALKPQMILVAPLLYWHSKRLALGGVLAAALCGVVSLVYAGVADHLDYATRILPSLSAGYAFYPNQSWTGAVLRVAGQPFRDFALPSPSAAARVVAMALNVTTLAAAVVLLRNAARRGRTRDPESTARAIGFAWLAVTLASPISWEHHYLPCMFLFALLVAARDWPARSRLLAACAFPLVASYIEVRAWTGLVGRVASSYCLLGGVLLAVAFAIALERGRPSDDAQSPRSVRAS